MRKGLSKILLGLAIACAVVIGMKPSQALASTVTVNTPREIYTALGAGNSIILGSDIDLSSSDAPFHIASGADSPVVIDLNGHTLTAGESAFIVDANVSAYVYDSATGGTMTGCTADELFHLTDNSTLTIAGGTFSNNARVVYGWASTLNITGGTFSGNINTDGAVGGVVYMDHGSTLNVYGGTFSGNTASEGGALKIDNSTATIAGGTFSNNTATSQGGAVSVYNTTLTMTGGTMSGNTAAATVWGSGGGAIFAGGTSVFHLDGGTLTSNFATGSGGAVLFVGTTMTVGKLNTDGTTASAPWITGNTSENHEGGGLSLMTGDITMYAASVIGNKAGYHKDGTENTDFADWGGGGIFVAEYMTANADGTYGATLYIPTTVNITNNTAGGFGGGVAGCSTGRLVLSSSATTGAAIYGNTADMKHVSGATSAKNEDHTFALQNDVFMANGADDYFCVFSSSITNSMLGGYANWTGSVDGVAYTAPTDADTTISSSSAVGLKSNLGSDYQGTTTKIQISDNESYTHGGGILSNGYLILGKPTTNSVDTGKPVEVIASKALLGTDGTALANMDDKTFTFTMRDDNGNVVATGSADSTGKITFDRRIVFNKDNCPNDENLLTYTITEDAGTDAVKYDSSPITIGFLVTRNNVVKTLSDGTTLTYTWYTIDDTSIAVMKDDKAVAFTSKYLNDESHGAVITLTDAAFTNREIAPASASLSATKTLSGAALSDGEFSFQLRDAATGDVLQTKANVGGSVSFDAITYDAAGTYDYTVSEVQGGAAGYTYDAAVHAARVVVTDDGRGQLSAAVTYDGGASAPAFANSYAPAPASASLSATKTLSGAALSDGEFSFQLRDAATGDVLQTKANVGGSVSFDAITYDAAGTYDYTVSEVQGGAAGYTYDAAVHAARVVVTDDGRGQLSAAVTYDGGASAPAFANSYNGHDVSFSKIDAVSEKELSGATLKVTSDAAGTTVVKDLKTDEDLSWTSTDTAKTFSLVPGTYYFQEEKAPNGYEEAETIAFTVETDGTISSTTEGAASGSTVTMKDARTTTPVTPPMVTPNTGDITGNPVGVALAAGAALIAGSVIGLRRRRDER